MASISSPLTASELMADAQCELAVTMRYDWRWRLGLWMVCLGVRLMGAQAVKVKDADAPKDPVDA